MKINLNAVRCCKEEPLYIRTETEIAENISCAIDEKGNIFPAQKTDDGVIVILTSEEKNNIELTLSDKHSFANIELKENTEKLDILFDGKLFSSYRVRKSFGAIKITLAVQLRKFLITFLFLLPCVAVGGYLVFALSQGIGQLIFISLSVSSIVLGITGFFFSFVFCQRYFLAPYLYFENEPCKANEVVALSGKIMEKKCFETAMLKLSFFPWWLLCVLIFPAVYVYPYYKLSISFKAITILTNNT